VEKRFGKTLSSRAVSRTRAIPSEPLFHLSSRAEVEQSDAVVEGSPEVGERGVLKIL
jgi:hypothetical protein